MLIQANLPQTFWEKAIMTIVYLVNRNPLVTINCLTLKEKLCGHYTNIVKLKIFRCQMYVNVKQGKLEPRALKRIFVGYLEGVKGHKVSCTDFRPPKYIISRTSHSMK